MLEQDIYQLVRQVLETLDRPVAAETASPREEATEPQRLYLVTQEELERLANPQAEPTVVEADTTPRSDTPEAATPETPEAQEPKPGEDVALPQAPATQPRRVRRASLLVALLLLLLLSTGLASDLLLLPTLATAEVTIVPVAKTLHQMYTFPIATTTTAKGVQGRLLQPVSFSASKTVAATGKGHQDATQAAGVITFFNGELSPVTIAAGTTLQGADAVQIVINASVTVQQATPPQEGQASIYAHSLLAGTRGNIAAHDIHTACCTSSSILAANLTPFQGGVDERSYSYVTSSDLANTAQELQDTVTQPTITSLTKLLGPGESLVPPLCTPRTLASNQPGEEATQLRVTVVQTCKSIAYTAASLQSVATATLIRSSHLDHFQQVGAIELTVTKAATDGRTASITISLSGTWVYSFSARELTRFKTMIAGKQEQHAQELLQAGPGIEQATVTLQRLDWRTVVPTDPGKISIHFFYVVS